MVNPKPKNPLRPSDPKEKPTRTSAVVLLTFVAFTVAAMPSTQSTSQIDLPPLLMTQDGAAITTAQQWTQTRRGEIIELFRSNIYGRAPVGRPKDMSFTVAETDPHALNDTATGTAVDIRFSGPGGSATIRLTLFVPRTANVLKPVPCFLLICNHDKHTIALAQPDHNPYWPVRTIVNRGYAAAAFFNGDVSPDRSDAWNHGVHAIFNPKPLPPDAWGTIAAWSWGASRALDYLDAVPQIDAKKVAVVGHSRGGKAALWAGAEDQRFAMVVSNESGCTGAAVARGKTGERIADINKAFPHWLCGNYKRYDGRENDLPVDQHMLAALMAPRLLYIASAADDAWSDPSHEFWSASEAGSVYALFGLQGVNAKSMPPVNTPLLKGSIGYHLRTGGHGLTEYDWKCFLDFADLHVCETQRTAKK
jgi:hypothetical protein